MARRCPPGAVQPASVRRCFCQNPQSLSFIGPICRRGGFLRGARYGKVACSGRRRPSTLPWALKGSASYWPSPRLHTLDIVYGCPVLLNTKYANTNKSKKVRLKNGKHCELRPCEKKCCGGTKKKLPSQYGSVEVNVSIDSYMLWAHHCRPQPANLTRG